MRNQEEFCRRRDGRRPGTRQAGAGGRGRAGRGREGKEERKASFDFLTSAVRGRGGRAGGQGGRGSTITELTSFSLSRSQSVTFDTAAAAAAAAGRRPRARDERATAFQLTDPRWKERRTSSRKRSAYANLIQFHTRISSHGQMKTARRDQTSSLPTSRRSHAQYEAIVPSQTSSSSLCGRGHFIAIIYPRFKSTPAAAPCRARAVSQNPA